MIAICTPQLSNHIRRALETMLDGSENALISLDENGMELQSEDRSSICLCMFRFDRRLFLKYVVSKPITVTFSTRDLHTFLKKKYSGHYIFYFNNGLSVRIVNPNCGSQEKTFHIKNDCLDTIYHYYDIPSGYLDHYCCFRINPDEFMNIILTMALGSGYINFVVQHDSIKLHTEFETGEISLIAKTHKKHDGFRTIKSNRDSFTNTYITKYLKQACHLVSICVDLHIYICDSKPIVLKFIMGDIYSTILMSVIPV